MTDVPFDPTPKLVRYEVVFLESSPWTDYDLDDRPVLGDAVAGLPEPFLVAVEYLHRHSDNAWCWRCGALVGWVLDEGPDDRENLVWMPTGLVHEVAEDSGWVVPARAMCEGCTPYVDPVSYREALRRQREMATDFVEQFGKQNG
jgi:hypothetical protein